MRIYLIEDIADTDIEKARTAFDELELRGGLDGIYYLPLPDELLQQEQETHANECGPYFMALEFLTDRGVNQLRLELLVRAKNKMRCSCVSYATSDQRKHMIEYLDQFLDELEISI
ncbi:hypothetical protein [Pseudodesulfovibrio piezophilus]|uniref:Uncharacterized protein n=1 Tax=Pseudodesulfovibrio piezophilus (strain DSM 21447 / JCM 15486 / C1TLV30) TaxID=1322246 RepID=M1WLJ1_PSEP2|nr:hypothetical protein [Pseudodesulfovibrio piezophilus]CCH47955.1 conserved protein of unknown function [Pseudodesulfovibrio piezophilus C1TLV30]